MRNFIQYLRSLIKVIPKEHGEKSTGARVSSAYMGHLLGIEPSEETKKDRLGMPVVEATAGPITVTIHEKGIRIIADHFMPMGDTVEMSTKPGWINPHKIIEVRAE